MGQKQAPSKVAVSRDFSNALADLPKKPRERTWKAIDKFMENPNLPGLDYKKPNNMANDNYRSIRITDDYRAILHAPDKNDISIFLWVDSHDEAYEWGRKNDIRIHPEKGNIQIFSAEEAQQQVVQKQEYYDEEGLFEDIRDRHLVSLGVPEALLETINQIKSEEQLDDISEYLPEEVSEILYLLAAGYSVEEVDRELSDSGQSGDIDTEDFEKAMNTTRAQRDFLIAEDDDELEKKLNASLEEWRVFLHPSQQELVEMDADGPVRVLGGAGTGKTVVAMHRAKYLAENVVGENEKVLFTTFSKNLVADLKNNMRKICDKKHLEKIDIINFDRWAWQFLENQGYEYDIKYDTDQFWDEALNYTAPDLPYSEQFYKNEWEQIIQPKDIQSKKEYLKIPRLGRETLLEKDEREAIWPVFDEYRTLLDQRGIKEIDDAIRDARQVIKEKGNVTPYRSLVLDEAQDMGAQVFKLFRTLIPEADNDLFIVGDAHQRIYRYQVDLSQCGIDVDGREKKLKINYRTTEENRKWADKILEDVFIDNLDGDYDPQKGYMSLIHGMEPEVIRTDSFKDEIEVIEEYLQEVESESLASLCLIARTNDLLNEYKGALKLSDIKTYEIERGEEDVRSKPGLRLATMHRAKGLEFDRVIVAGVNEGNVPLNHAMRGIKEDSIYSEKETQERGLFYVAVTRAITEVLVTCSGTPSPFLDEIENGQ